MTQNRTSRPRTQAELVGPDISVITLSRDNPDQLEKTVKSVALQTVPPDTYIVFDSSRFDVASRMKSIADSVGAAYVWAPPEGIYPAMRKSLALIPAESYSWWINSSDWLAGRKSVEIAKDEIRKHSNDVSWLVGQLIRLKDNNWAYHRTGTDGEKFLKAMRSGRIGFPHPSTVFWTPYLKRVKPYEDGLKIASDYATALRFGRTFGPPLISRSTISIHVPEGISAQKPLRNVIEKSRSRLATNPKSMQIAEPILVLRNVIRGSLQYLTRHPGGDRILNSHDGFLGENEHFCSESSDWNWPQCCDTALSH